MYDSMSGGKEGSVPVNQCITKESYSKGEEVSKSVNEWITNRKYSEERKLVSQ